MSDLYEDEVDEELAAMRAVAKILSRLSKEQRRKVLDWARQYANSATRTSGVVGRSDG